MANVYPTKLTLKLNKTTILANESATLTATWAPANVTASLTSTSLTSSNSKSLRITPSRIEKSTGSASARVEYIEEFSDYVDSTSVTITGTCTGSGGQKITNQITITILNPNNIIFFTPERLDSPTYWASMGTIVNSEYEPRTYMGTLSTELGVNITKLRFVYDSVSILEIGYVTDMLYNFSLSALPSREEFIEQGGILYVTPVDTPSVHYEIKVSKSGEHMSAYGNWQFAVDPMSESVYLEAYDSTNSTWIQLDNSYKEGALNVYKLFFGEYTTPQ